jgi:hypothetical protein
MKKRYRHIAFFLMVFVVLSGCTSMVTAMVEKQLQKQLEAQKKQLEAQIEQYEKMVFDETIAARFVGTWRNVSLVGVTVYSFSGDGSMTAAIRMFAGGQPDNFLSCSYKASKDTFAQRYYTGAIPGENPESPTVSVSFFNYQFNDNYSEITFDFAGFGLEFGSAFTRIDDKYTDTISAASLDMPRNAAQNAALLFDHVWRQPNEVVKDNKYADWTATFRVNSIRINDKELGLLSGINLLEREYEIYFNGTITFRRGLDYHELPMAERFRTKIKKGHVYEVKAYVKPEDMYLTLTLGPYQHDTLGTAVTLTEISLEQYDKEYW